MGEKPEIISKVYLSLLDIHNTERMIINSNDHRRAAAMLKVGLKYYEDEDIKDLGKAFDYFNRASEFESKAFVYLGDMYFKGEYVAKDRARAFECYLKEGKYDDHSKEMILKHYLYEWLMKNFKAAFKWYMEVNEDAFNDNRGKAFYYLAVKFNGTKGIDNKKIPEWYQKAAELGNGPAKILLESRFNCEEVSK